MRRPSRERTLFVHVSLPNCQQTPTADGLYAHTGRSCRGWRRKRSTAASSTSWALRTPGRRRHPRYHLINSPLSFLFKLPLPAGAPCSSTIERLVHTDSSGLDHVADGESLNCLVLRRASRAVGAADWLDVAAALLVTTAVNKSAFRSTLHDRERLCTWMRAS